MLNSNRNVLNSHLQFAMLLAARSGLREAWNCMQEAEQIGRFSCWQSVSYKRLSSLSRNYEDKLEHPPHASFASMRRLTISSRSMLWEQARRTPPGQWVRVVGGWSEFQFAERRMPTLDELNQAAPDTPVFVLHLYDRALLNRAALRAVGYTKESPNPPGGEIVRDTRGNPTGTLMARPNAMIAF
jgi:hypothetical protein